MVKYFLSLTLDLFMPKVLNEIRFFVYTCAVFNWFKTDVKKGVANNAT